MAEFLGGESDSGRRGSFRPGARSACRLDATDRARGKSAAHTDICRARPGRRRGIRSTTERQPAGQLGPGAHAELPVDGGDVRLDGPHADEQRRRGVPVGRAGRDQAGDPPLGRGQLAAGPFRGHPRQLPLDLGEQRPVAHLGGQLVGAAQRVAGLPAGLAPPLDLAQDQQAAGQLEAQRGGPVRRHRGPGRAAAASRSPALARTRASIRWASPVSAGRPSRSPSSRSQAEIRRASSGRPTAT